MQNEIKSVTFIGSGNVATHLAYSFYSKGIIINQVFSRSISNAESLAQCVHAEAIDNLKHLKKDSDLYIIAVSDGAIPEIVSGIKLSNKFIVHTSGFSAMEVLQGVSKRYGVLYPLQSFVKARKIELNNVPFCLETNEKEDMEALELFARKVSSAIKYIDSAKRKQLHLAAVFACNFPNYLYAVAEKILTANHLSFDLLKPLITETAERIQKLSPEHLQTGPARRNDTEIINEHIAMIQQQDFKELYALISKNIIKKYYPHD